MGSMTGPLEPLTHRTVFIIYCTPITTMELHMPQGAQKLTDVRQSLQRPAGASEDTADFFAFRIVTRAGFQKVSA
jgi:hypothetical protein